MTNIRQVLADNIRTFRKEKGLSQAKLAELADSAPHYILMLESGRSWPSAEFVERLALALDKDSIDLFSQAAVKADWKAEILERIADFVRNGCEDRTGKQVYR
jgi:transcriptional regulator with XRE-family HTH domain